MAYILNIETATTNCSVSIAKDGRLIAIKEHDTPNYSHSEQLHQFIDEVIKEADLRISDIAAVAVSKGPGSYTGLRIGVSAAKGLCFSLEVPLIAVDTLKSIACQPTSIDFEYVIPLLDARRMEVYAKVFDKNLKEIRVTKAEIIDADSFSEFSKEAKVLLRGSGAAKCQDILEAGNLEYDLSAVPSSKEMASLSFLQFQDKDFEDIAYFEPYYLKDFMIQTKKK